MWWVDVLETLSGGALLTLALANESQEKNVQSWLETAWLQLAYAEDAAINRHMQFMHQLANVCNSVLNHLFGKRLISLRGLFVSATLGLALFLLSFLFLFFLIDDSGINKIIAGERLTTDQAKGALFFMQSILGLAGFYLLVFALLPALLKPKVLSTWSVLAGLLWLWMLGPCTSVPSTDITMHPFFLAVCLGMLSDLVLVYFLRIVFRIAGTTKSVLVSLLLTCGSVACGLIVASLPIVLSFVSANRSNAQISFLLMLLNNLAVVVIALLPLWVVAAFACHKLLWRPLGSTLYALQRYRTVTEHKPALVYCGLTLTTIGLGSTPIWILTSSCIQQLCTFVLGFGVVVFASSLLRMLADRSRLQRVANGALQEGDLDALIASIVGRFAIDTSNLDSAEKKQLAIRQLVERRRRFRLGIIFASILVVSASIILLALVLR